MATTDGIPHVRRHDPTRRDRIIDACLDVIAEVGVAGTSHRKVAAAADVPLGSMSYHFQGMDDLLREAFARFSQAEVAKFELRLSALDGPEAAKHAVADIISHDLAGGDRNLILTHELYTLAARDPRFRDLTNAWMARSRQALEQYFDPETARLLDALLEGLTTHRTLDSVPHDHSIAIAGVDRLTR